MGLLHDRVRSIVKTGIEKIFAEEVSFEAPEVHYPGLEQIFPEPVTPIIEVSSSKDLESLIEDTSLTSLDLRFYKLLPANFEAFFYSLKELTSLNSLKLDFAEVNNLRDQDIEVLASGLYETNKLEIFSMNLPKIARIDDFSFDSLVSAIRHLSLKSLTINPCFGISQPGLESLLSDLKSMDSLAELNLDLSQTKCVDDYILDLLSSALGNLSNLFRLNIDISGSLFIADENTLWNFISTLETLKDLKYLTLGLNSVDVFKPTHFEALSQALYKMSRLHFLSISLTNSNVVDDKSALSFSKSLKTLKYLQSLHLDFKLASYLTDRHSEILLSTLYGIPNLRSLNLSFARTIWIGESTLGCLSESFSKLRNLEKLQLDFSFGDLISTLSLEKLMLSIQKLTDNKALIDLT